MRTDRRPAGRSRWGWGVGVLALVPGVCGSGCQGMNHTEEGALGGGVIGAGAGALVGSALCHRGGAATGALIGGALGATTGAVAGSNQDEREHQHELRLA